MPPCEDCLSRRVKDSDLLFVEEDLSVSFTKGDDHNELVVEGGEYVNLT